MNAVNYNKQNKPKYHEQTRTNPSARKKNGENPRWSGITRPYSAEEVLKLRGNIN